MEWRKKSEVMSDFGLHQIRSLERAPRKSHEALHNGRALQVGTGPLKTHRVGLLCSRLAAQGALSAR